MPPVTYVVRRGDRLTAIAARLHTSITAIVLANHMTNPDRLSEGQVLKIPTHAPLVLLVKPSKGPQGQQFQLDLIGAKPTEVIRFEIDSPAGKRNGPPHIASKDGSVTTKYTSGLTDQAGTYKVVAVGNQGTRTQTAFVVVKRP